MVQENAATILGSRGSIPVSGPDFVRYGGATTCVLVRLENTTVVLDAGSGLLNLPGPAECSYLPEKPKPLPILITHPHLDHLLGIPLCNYSLKPGGGVNIYMKAWNGRDGKDLMDQLYTPPFWPVRTDQLPSKITFNDLPDSFDLGAIHVDVTEGVHPGGVSLLRVSGGGKRVVFMTDCTLAEDRLPEFTDFARSCDLLLVDGQYSDEEWPTRKNYGHSTWTAAARFSLECGARETRIIHHDPARKDATLDAAEGEIRRINPRCRFAREGEKIGL